MLVCLFLGTDALAREKAPLNRDGWRHGAIHNGRQNMPVILPGVARQWSGGCASGKAADCRRLANAFTNGHGDVRRNMRVAIGYWLAACRAGDGPACGTAAEIVRGGSAGYVDHDLAFAMAQRGCDTYRDADACAMSGVALHRGEGTARDPVRAMALWTTACGGGGMEACRLQAAALREAGDIAGSLALARKGCDSGRGWGCGQLASAYRFGEGVAANSVDAARLADRGCGKVPQSDPDACAHHGYYLAQSTNRADVERASFLLSKSCLAGSVRGCFEAGELGRRNPAGSKIARWEVALFYRDGCDSDHALACHRLGQLYLEGHGQVRRDADRAIALIDHACALGDGTACGRARMLGTVSDTARRRIWAVHPAQKTSDQVAAALALVKSGRALDGFDVVARLMEEGDADASWVLAGWVFYGLPGVIDTPRPADGVTLAEGAARQGHSAAARWVGMVLWEGDRVPVNRERGRDFMRIAMRSGEPLDEALYRSMAGNIARDAAEAEMDRRLAASYSPPSFWGQVIAGLAASSYKPSYSSRPASSDGAWARYQQQADRRDFNNYLSYMRGSASVCASSNRYC